MYEAELHGKFSSRFERMEDILTSNVFSFFKYAKRTLFLQGYLKYLGFPISEQEVKNAQFLFWPRYEDNTEPDLVLIVGGYYLLFEAKYFSEFAKETLKVKSQLKREIDGGLREAKNYGKQFYLIAITRDAYRQDDKYEDIPRELKKFFVWSNWQTVAYFIDTILNTNMHISEEEYSFALDLYNLLDKKNLRGYKGWEQITLEKIDFRIINSSLFFEARTADFRGDFIGFSNTLQLVGKIMPPKEHMIFFDGRRDLFSSLLNYGLKHKESSIFFQEGE